MNSPFHPSFSGNFSYLRSTHLIVLAGFLAVNTTGCPVGPIDEGPNNDPITLESLSYGVNEAGDYEAYFTSNNDGSLMIDRPIAPATEYEGDAWLSALYSSTSGICSNFELGTYIDGVSDGDYTYTAEINGAGNLASYVYDFEVEPNPRIAFMSCSDNGTLDPYYLPFIPFPEERASEVLIDVPFEGEVTINFPYVLRGDSADLTDDEAFLPLSIYPDNLNDLCYYYGMGDITEYLIDEEDWNITAVLGVRDGFSGSLKNFNVADGSFYNDGMVSISCYLPAKAREGLLARKASGQTVGKIKIGNSKEKRASTPVLTPIKKAVPVDGGRKASESPYAAVDSLLPAPVKATPTEEVHRKNSIPTLVKHGDKANRKDIPSALERFIKAKGLDKKFPKI